MLPFLAFWRSHQPSERLLVMNVVMVSTHQSIGQILCLSVCLSVFLSVFTEQLRYLLITKRDAICSVLVSTMETLELGGEVDLCV